MQEPAELVGKVLSRRYRITEFIGAGGMAWVYQAMSSERAALVAIKVLHPELAGDPAYQRRFRLEAKIAAKIAHPGAVQVFEHGVHEALPFIAMELLDGPNLATVVSVRGRLEARRALLLLSQVCEVVHAAHREGVLHRDLKPENVVVLGQPPDERVKVLDFGLAKIYAPRPGAENTTSGLTVQGTVVGTPEYMSPEQCAGEKLDQRADVYSCGALLYHVLTGQPPFEGTAPYAVMLQQMNEPVVPPTALVPAIPAAVEAAVLKALRKEPSARFQTARHMQLALLKLAGLEPREPAAEPAPVEGFQEATLDEELESPPDERQRATTPPVRQGEPSDAAWQVAQRVAALSRSPEPSAQPGARRVGWALFASIALALAALAALWATR